MQTATKNFEVIRKTDDLIYYHFAKENSYAISKADDREVKKSYREKVKKIKHIY